MINAESMPCSASAAQEQYQRRIVRSECSLDYRINAIKDDVIDELVSNADEFEELIFNHARSAELTGLLHKIYGYAHEKNVPPELLGELFRLMTEMGDDYAQRIAEKNV